MESIKLHLTFPVYYFFFTFHFASEKWTFIDFKCVYNWKFDSLENHLASMWTAAVDFQLPHILTKPSAPVEAFVPKTNTATPVMHLIYSLFFFYCTNEAWNIKSSNLLKSAFYAQHSDSLFYSPPNWSSAVDWICSHSLVTKHWYIPWSSFCIFLITNRGGSAWIWISEPEHKCLSFEKEIPFMIPNAMDRAKPLNLLQFYYPV